MTTGKQKAALITGTLLLALTLLPKSQTPMWLHYYNHISHNTYLSLAHLKCCGYALVFYAAILYVWCYVLSTFVIFLCTGSKLFSTYTTVSWKKMLSRINLAMYSTFMLCNKYIFIYFLSTYLFIYSICIFL